MRERFGNSQGKSVREKKRIVVYLLFGLFGADLKRAKGLWL